MPIQSQGQTLSNQVSFNSGTMSINGVIMAALQDVTIAEQFSQKELYALGSIKQVVAPKRYGFKPSAKAKVKSMNKELFYLLGGSSGPDGSGNQIQVVDGQNVLSSVYINCIMNDDSTKTLQFQFTNAILSGNFQALLKSEDHGEVDIEVYATDVTVVTNY